MPSNDFDAIVAVESLYRTGLTNSAWLSAVMTSVQPLLDPQRRGLFAGFYDCLDPLSFAPEPILSLECDDRLLSIFREGLGALSEAFVAGAFLCPGIVRGAEIPGWNEIPPVRGGALQALGLVDDRSLVAVEPDGRGCRLTTFYGELGAQGQPDRRLVSGLFRHFVAAHRLQRSLRGRASPPDEADAVLDSTGRLHHTQGAARNPALHEPLRRAMLASEGSRGQRRRQDPLAALAAWDSLVLGRWTLVDHFDHDGRRYVLALENSPKPPGFKLLSTRERQVVEQAVLGSHNKAIAYDLGLSHSTVRVLMSRAATKLGVRTRPELLAKAGPALRGGREGSTKGAANMGELL